MRTSTSVDFRMLKAIVAVVVIMMLWEPIRPIRTVTAEALYTAGDLIAR
jgi:hypothetical protein